MLRGGPPPPEPGSDGGYSSAGAGGMPGGFNFGSGSGGMPGGGVRYEFSSGGPGGGGFSFSNPESIFSEFLRGQAGMGGGDGFEDLFSGGGGIPRARQNSGRPRPAYGSESRQRAQTPEPTTVERPLELTLERTVQGHTQEDEDQAEVV